MSSWIPSLFNPFSDDDDPSSPAPTSPSKGTPRSPSSGAKDDLSAVFRGVAAFLAPPQTTSASGPSSSSETIEGIRHDLAEIQGSFRSGFSLLSSKLTSNFLQLKSQLNDGDENYEVEEEEEEEEEEYTVGIDEEIVDFVRKISGRSELWTDFPLSLPDDLGSLMHDMEQRYVILKASVKDTVSYSYSGSEQMTFRTGFTKVFGLKTGEYIRPNYEYFTSRYGAGSYRVMEGAVGLSFVAGMDGIESAHIKVKQSVREFRTRGEPT